MQTPDKAQTRAHLESMAAEATTPLNISDEAREMVAAMAAPVPRTLTTADIGAYAAQVLRQARVNAMAQHSRAMDCAGQDAALHCSRRIDTFAESAERVSLLEALASVHGDEVTAAAIRADARKTQELLRQQATCARMLSIPGWNHATQSFSAAQQVAA